MSKNYNIDDVKSIGLRIARRINKSLQRSKLNSELKPYFTENTVKFVCEPEFIGIELNENAIDMNEMLDELTKERFINNIHLVREFTDRVLRQEGVEDLFNFSNHPDTDECIELDNNIAHRYNRFALRINNENQTIVGLNDMIDDKVKSLVPGFTVNSYEIAPESPANAVTKDFAEEISNKNDKEETVLADPMQGKMKRNNSSKLGYEHDDYGIQKDIFQNK